MPGEKQRITIGHSDFKEFRDDGFYFVDKSELISDILKDGSKVFLFTRPRRFGKSLNLSMLDAFFNIKYKGNTWFDGLKIDGHPEVEVHKNAYPVIKLSMDNLDFLDFEQFLSDFKYNLMCLYDEFGYLADSTKLVPTEREDYRNMIFGNADISVLAESLHKLCSMLKQHHGVKPIVLFDEYDYIFNHAYGKESYGEISEFIREFYARAFKDEDCFEFAFLTGVMQIPKEEIFPGLDNLKIDSVLNIGFEERCGFTESEVEALCSYIDQPEKFDNVKEWYEGYRYGNAVIYNPWSVMNYLKGEHDLRPYWVDTSGNDILRLLLKNSDKETFKDLISLGNGENISKKLQVSDVMNSQNGNIDTIFTVLAIAGYLNAVPSSGDTYLLSIPNKEIYDAFDEHFPKFAYDKIVPCTDLLRNAKYCNLEEIEKVLSKLSDKNRLFPLFDPENNSDMILAGMIMDLRKEYRLTLEHETEIHYLVLERRLTKYPNIVIGFRTSGSEDGTESERLAHEAIEQIHQRDYCKILKGTTYLYGICFSKKPRVILEKTLF